MLAVKLLEMTANPALRNDKGDPKGSVVIAIVLGWASVFGFALWLLMQGSAFPEPITPANAVETYESRADCIAAAQTYDDLDACQK